MNQQSRVVVVDRSHPLNLDSSKHFGRGHLIVGEDYRATSLTEIDLNRVTLECGLLPGEEFVTLEERIKRLDALQLVRLDVGILLVLLDNQHLIPKRWQRKIGRLESSPRVYFEGTTLSNGKGERRVAYIFPSYRGYWKLSWEPLEKYIWEAELSAVVPLSLVRTH